MRLSSILLALRTAQMDRRPGPDWFASSVASTARQIAEGGADAWGAVFSVNPETGYEKVVHAFTAYPDGRLPNAGLTDVGGILYGTTPDGGGGSCYFLGCGVVYSLDPKSGSETVLYSFQNDGFDGNNPYAGLTNVNGTLYGTTSSGGRYENGTVFFYTPGKGEGVLYSFGNSDGMVPMAGVIKVGGKLYGTTKFGGAWDCGTVFSVSLKTGAETVLHSFGGGSDGGQPLDGLIAANGTLYGTTPGGGRGYGTVFSITPRGAYKVLYAFGGNSRSGDGSWPQTGLINVNGTLYGTTAGGGAYGWGTVFSVTSAGTETVLHSFGNGSDGSDPLAGLINVNGTLYGTTNFGGTYGYGTVFSINP
jgi:uncharacterized repeat protein (TIGR03803 family)